MGSYYTIDFAEIILEKEKDRDEGEDDDDTGIMLNMLKYLAYG